MFGPGSPVNHPTLLATSDWSLPGDSYRKYAMSAFTQSRETRGLVPISRVACGPSSFLGSLLAGATHMAAPGDPCPGPLYDRFGPRINAGRMSFMSCASAARVAPRKRSRGGWHPLALLSWSAAGGNLGRNQPVEMWFLCLELQICFSRGKSPRWGPQHAPLSCFQDTLPRAGRGLPKRLL